jgi:hypothetical protein
MVAPSVSNDNLHEAAQARNGEHRGMIFVNGAADASTIIETWPARTMRRLDKRRAPALAVIRRIDTTFRSL